MSNQAPGQNENVENYILFYSDRCGQCKKFNDLLQEYPHINSRFKKFDINILINSGRLPPQLTHIPGVMDGNKLIMGPDAFTWLKNKTTEIIGSVDFNDTGNVGFSFFGEPDHDFNTNHSNFEKGDPNDGINIDSSKFNESGGPIQNVQYNPSPPPPQQQQGQPMFQQQQQFQNQQSNFQQQQFQQNSQGNSQGNGQRQLPAALQPQKIDKSSGRMNDSEMQRYMSQRETF